MAVFPSGLIGGDEAKAVYGKRSKSVDEKTVTAAKKEALATKIQGEEQDGWTVVKRNKKSVRMSKPKPPDRQLEDDVWCLLYSLRCVSWPTADFTLAVRRHTDLCGSQSIRIAKGCNA